MRNKVICIVILIGLLFFVPIKCCAKEMEPSSVQDYYDSFLEQDTIHDMDDDLQQIYRKYSLGTQISFSKVMDLFLEGKVDEGIDLVIASFFENLSKEIFMNKDLLIRIVILVLIAAVFHNYSSILKVSYVGEQGFYITYLMIGVLLIQSFTLVYDIATETVQYICDLMDCMLPAFFLSLVLCAGLSTSQMMNTMFVSMLTLIENLLLNVIFPSIRIYFLVVLLNQINRKDRFSKLAGLIKQGIQFLLKGTVTGVIGLNVVKSMLVPVYENAKYNVLQKGLSMIPGGNSLAGLSSLLVGAGMLIKNSVGITVVLLLIILGGIPLLKIVVFYVTYRVLVALIQPISDQRILSCIQGVCDSTGIMLRATMTSIVLSVLSIAIVIVSTNVRV